MRVLRTAVAGGFAIALATSAGGRSLAGEDTALPGLDLEWRADPVCPGEGWARRRMEEHLGGRAIEVRARAQVSIRREGRAGPFQAIIRTSNGAASGEREFVGRTCDSVASAAVLVVAIAIDPITVADRVEARSPLASGVEIGVGPAMAGDVGSLPSPTLGGGVALSAKLRRMLLGVGAMAWLPRLEDMGPRPDTGGLLELYTASASACYSASTFASIELAACAGTEAGTMVGRGVNLRFPETSRGVWVAAFGGVRLSGRAGALRPHVSLDVGVPFVRPVFEIEGYGQVFRASPLVGRATMAVAWIFP